MATLYRQYRPGSFKEIIGQEHITETLKAAIKKSRLTHAYLFHGPRGTGKTTTARLLAKRVNCLNAKEVEACGRCKSCRAVIAGSNIDLIEIDAASNRGIDDIRALRERIASAPSLGKYKVYIIDEVHMLTPEASAALLKTLEEPVAHAMFVLATTELHKVLPTILSRCQIFRFRRATGEELAKRLKYLLKKEKRVAEEAVIEFIIERSDGCFRDAESLLGQLLTLQPGKLKRDALIDSLGLPPIKLIEQFVGSLRESESAGAVAAVDEAIRGGYDPEQFVRETIIYARDTAMRELAEGKNEAEGWSELVRALLQALQDLAYVPQPTIALHLAVLTVCTKKGESGKGASLPVKKSEDVKPTSASSSSLKLAAKDSTPSVKKQVREMKSTLPGNSADLTVVQNVWPKLIEQVKKKNPVASTFLRAVEPIGANEGQVTIRTRYPLHKNFFATEKNMALVTSVLADLISRQVTLNFVLDEAGSSTGPSSAQMRQAKDDKFFAMVKEVFE